MWASRFVVEKATAACRRAGWRVVVLDDDLSPVDEVRRVSRCLTSRASGDRLHRRRRGRGRSCDGAARRPLAVTTGRAQRLGGRASTRSQTQGGICLVGRRSIEYLTSTPAFDEDPLVVPGRRPLGLARGDLGAPPRPATRVRPATVLALRAPGSWPSAPRTCSAAVRQPRPVADLPMTTSAASGTISSARSLSSGSQVLRRWRRRVPAF